MSDKSPLFVSAIELLAHATETYSQGNNKKYKFVILHLANSIELILKDKLIDEGESIYNKSSETISIWKSFELLQSKGIVIKERPIFELLIDDRNTIQHRFGYTNADSVYYYLEIVVLFFKNFLDNYYGVNLAEVLSLHLSKENLAFIGLAKDEFEGLYKLYQVSPDAAVVHAFANIEKEVSKIATFNSGAIISRINYRDFLECLVNGKYISAKAVEGFLKLRSYRNQAAHSANSDFSDEGWKESFDTALEILKSVKKANEDGFFQTK